MKVGVRIVEELQSIHLVENQTQMTQGLFAAIAVLSFAQLGIEFFQEHQVRVFGIVIFLLSCLGLFA